VGRRSAVHSDRASDGASACRSFRQILTGVATDRFLEPKVGIEPTAYALPRYLLQEMAIVHSKRGPRALSVNVLQVLRVGLLKHVSFALTRRYTSARSSIASSRASFARCWWNASLAVTPKASALSCLGERLLGDEPVLHRVQTRGGACRRVDLVVDVLDVVAGRLRGDDEALGDLPVRHATCK
jgi:hypothetical protein